MLVGLVFVLVVVSWLVLRLPPFGGRFEGARLARMQISPQWHGGRFENSPPQDRRRHLLRSWQLYRQGQRREPRFEVPVVPVDARRLQAPPEPGLRAWWLGHATVLLEIDGLRVLTDPVLSDHASPFPIGVQRLHASPLPIAALAGIDAIVVSHDHYDHLDMPTVRQLAGQGTHFYVGLGIGAHLERWGVPPDHIHEMDWWESQSLKGVTIHCTPARHYSGRRWMDNFDALELVAPAGSAALGLLQRRHRLRAALRRHPRALRGRGPHDDEGGRLRRDLARHPHAPGVGREVACRPRRPHPPPGALGHVQPLVPRLGGADPPYAGRGAGGRRRLDHAPPGRDVRVWPAVRERRLVRGDRVAHRENRQEIDKSAVQRIRRPAKSLPELVELMGIEPMTS
jgi:beta-lactamase family protein